jgi:spore coat protein A, manganese oxidase
MKSTRISRRKFLGMSALGGAGLMLARGVPAALAAPMSLTPYMVELPIPPKAVENAGVIRLFAKESTQAMHPQLPLVKVWGYNQDVGKTGGYLGPTIELDKNSSTTVELTNKLPNNHFLPVDSTVAGSRGINSRILTHLHGGFVSGTNDGNPYATQDEYEFGETQQVTYPPHPRATTLWYHDHALGMTRLNVYAGLAGFVRMRDQNDTGKEPNPLGIPGGKYEVPILLQDKTFSGGQLFYSATNTWIPEFFGNTPVVNGAVQPFLTVEPRMYRLTFLNGSQSRFYNLELAVGNNAGPVFHQIGSEGGMFDAPVRTNRILLLPAERADVIVDFSGFAGQNIELQNRSLPKGVVSPATPRIPSLMQFRVGGQVTSPPETTPKSVPGTLTGGSKPDMGGEIPAKTRYITLEEVLDAAGNPLWLQMNGHRFDAPVDEMPTEDTIEDWSFVNISADTHPIHMHLTNFQVMGRRPINGVLYAQDLANARAVAENKPLPFPARPTPPLLLQNNTIDPGPYYVGPEVPPAANETGWKDTVGANPNQVTRIRQMFDLPEGAEGSSPDSPERQYVYHCHILEHEDNDMMRPFKVIQ